MKLRMSSVLAGLMLFRLAISAKPPPTTTDLDSKGNPIYKAIGADFGVAAPKSTPTLVYNCKVMTLICENVAAWADKNGGTLGDLNGYPVFHFDPSLKDKNARREASCGCFDHDGCDTATSNGKNAGKKVVELAYSDGLQAISQQHKKIILTGKNPGVDPTNNKKLAARKPLQSLPGKFFKDGVAFSCDEFPAATWIQGGTLAETTCALQDWGVFAATGANSPKANGKGSGIGKWPLPKGSGVRREQNWQADSHRILRNVIKPGKGTDTIYPFSFTTAYIDTATKAYIKIDAKTTVVPKRDLSDTYSGHQIWAITDDQGEGFASQTPVPTPRIPPVPGVALRFKRDFSIPLPTARPLNGSYPTYTASASHSDPASSPSNVPVPSKIASRTSDLNNAQASQTQHSFTSEGTTSSSSSSSSSTTSSSTTSSTGDPTPPSLASNTPPVSSSNHASDSSTIATQSLDPSSGRASQTAHSSTSQETSFSSTASSTGDTLGISHESQGQFSLGASTVSFSFDQIPPTITPNPTITILAGQPAATSKVSSVSLDIAAAFAAVKTLKSNPHDNTVKSNAHDSVHHGKDSSCGLSSSIGLGSILGKTVGAVCGAFSKASDSVDKAIDGSIPEDEVNNAVNDLTQAVNEGSKDIEKAGEQSKDSKNNDDEDDEDDSQSSITTNSENDSTSSGQGSSSVSQPSTSSSNASSVGITTPPSTLSTVTSSSTSSSSGSSADPSACTLDSDMDGSEDVEVGDDGYNDFGDTGSDVCIPVLGAGGATVGCGATGAGSVPATLTGSTVTSSSGPSSTPTSVSSSIVSAAATSSIPGSGSTPPPPPPPSSTEAPPSSSSDQTSSVPPPPPPPPPLPSPSPSPDADTCDISYKVLWDRFEIHGINFDAAKFGDNGNGLKHQIKGCGKLTKWKFKMTPDDKNYQWVATGRLPIDTGDCVGRAVVSAGGADHGHCENIGPE